MCIAILQRRKIKRKILSNCFDNNPDGAGYMFHDGQELIIKKGFFTFKGFYSNYIDDWNKYKKVSDFILHFRIMTSGLKNSRNCHPHVVQMEKEKVKLAFVHNGIIDIETEYVSSDSIAFAKLLKQLPKNFLNNNAIISLIETRIEKSKLIFMDNKGETTIVNEDLGEWEKGNWFSNTSYSYQTYFKKKAIKELPIYDHCEFCGEALKDWENSLYNHEGYDICYNCYMAFTFDSPRKEVEEYA